MAQAATSRFGSFQRITSEVLDIRGSARCNSPIVAHSLSVQLVLERSPAPLCAAAFARRLCRNERYETAPAACHPEDRSRHGTGGALGLLRSAGDAVPPAKPWPMSLLRRVAAARRRRGQPTVSTSCSRAHRRPILRRMKKMQQLTPQSASPCPIPDLRWSASSPLSR